MLNSIDQLGSSVPSVVERIRDQAMRSPDAAAIIATDTMLTYRELLQRAQRVACRLREAGAGPDRVVGVCLERTSSAIVT